MAIMPIKGRPEAAGAGIKRQAPSGQKPEEKHPPQVDGFKLKASLKGDIKDMASALRAITFLEVAPEKDAISVIYVESRDINSNPYLFSVAKLSKDEVEMVYSIPPGIAPKKRRVDVILYLLNILSLVEKSFQIDNKAIYQLLESAVKDLTGSVTMDYTTLYTAYDSLKKEVDDLRKKVRRYSESEQALTTKNYELKTQNDELRLRVGELEGLSDDVMRSKLQEWIIEHNGAVNVAEFAKLFKVSEARVEEMLNRLVNDGYLEIVQ